MPNGPNSPIDIYQFLTVFGAVLAVIALHAGAIAKIQSAHTEQLSTIANDKELSPEDPPTSAKIANLKSQDVRYFDVFLILLCIFVALLLRLRTAPPQLLSTYVRGRTELWITLMICLTTLGVLAEYSGAVLNTVKTRDFTEWTEIWRTRI